MMCLKHRCNSLGKILEAKRLGYQGAEFDLVWEDGDLVLNHEHGGTGQLFHVMLDEIPSDMVLAINVKEYGMADDLQDILTLRDPKSYFIFDVPGPEIEGYISRSLRYFGRISEYETQASIWGKIVDSFDSCPDFVLDHIVDGDALISPTLRGLPEWPKEVLDRATYLVTK